MRHFIETCTLFIAFITLFACNGNDQKTVNQSPSFLIDANLTDLNYKKAYLSDRKDGEFINVDSCTIVNGKFSFSGKLELPEVRYVYFEEGNEMFSIFVENDSIKISGSLLTPENLKIDGGPTQQLFNEFKASIKTHDDKLNDINNKYDLASEKGNEEELAKIEAEYNAADSIKTNFIADFVKMNKGSVIAPYLSIKFLAITYQLDQLEALFALFEKDAKSSIYAQRISDRIAVLKSTQIGQKAPEFSMNDAYGNSISLSSFKGKYVLIDFWASWCAPCRAENPNVVAAFKKYNKKGFEVFSVSLDDTKEKWLEAIQKDGLTWTHVSDLKGWGNVVAKQYGISSIPHSVLVDKDGVIIGENLRGKELQNKLEELLK